LGHIIRLPEETPADTVLQHVINVTKGSHLAAGWKRSPGRPWKMWLQQVIAYQYCDIDVIWLMIVLRGDRYDPRWSDAAVSE